MKIEWMFGASLLALGAALSVAQAQEEPEAAAQPTAEEAESFDSEEVIVTATKRKQTLQEVPISLVAVSGAGLQERGFQQFTDLQSVVPNLQIDQTNGNFAITMRGLGAGAQNLAFEQSVGLFVDGVYASRARAFQTAFLDVERVEVVRGPQGALFGKNTNAGAISVVTKAPTDEFAAELRLSGEAIEGGYGTSGFVNGALADNVYGRLSFMANHTGPYIENRLTNRDEYANDSWGVRGQIRWDASEDVDVTLKLESARSDIDGGNVMFNSLGSPTCALCNLTRAAGGGTLAQEFPGYWRTQRSTQPQYNDTGVDSGTLTVNWKAGDDWRLTSITSYLDLSSEAFADADVGALTLLETIQAEESSQFFQEFRATGKIADVLDVVAGVTYMHTSLDITQNVRYLGNTLPPGYTSPTGVLNRTIDQTGMSLSPYLALDYQVTENIFLSGSVRFSYEEKEADIGQTRDAGNPPATNRPYALYGKRTERLWDYSLKARYQFDRDTSVYAGYATGTKGGGFISNDGLLLTNILAGVGKLDYEPEEAKSWEIGLKSRFWDRRADLNIALFHTDFTNLQVSTFNGTAFITGNAAEAVSKGVEVEATLRPTDWLTVGGGLAYLDAYYKDYPGGACLHNAPVGCSPLTNNLAGSRLTRAPEWKGNFFVQVERTVADGIFVSGRVSLDYTGLSYFQSDLDPLNAQPAYTKVDARLAIGHEDGAWEFALIGRNLTDEVTFSQAFNVPLIGGGSHGVMVAPPRTLTAELTLRF